MTSQLSALCFDANAPSRLARFWAGLLGREMADDDIALLPTDDVGFGSGSLRPRSRRFVRTRRIST